MMEYNYICLEKKIIHKERDGWFDWTKKDIYLFARENNGLNKYIFIVDFGERKIIIIKKYYYYY